MASPDPLAAELSAIRDRLSLATPGDWAAVTDDHGRKGIEHSVWSETAEAYVAEFIGSADDARFVATTRGDIPRLLDALDAVLALAAEFDLEDGHGDTWHPGSRPVSRGDRIRAAVHHELTGKED